MLMYTQRCFHPRHQCTKADCSPSQDIVGVGGLVGTAQALSKLKPKEKIDFSKVSVKLYTSEGLLKSSTDCAPNGYYFIRIYDKGSFVVRVQGPEGEADSTHRPCFTRSLAVQAGVSRQRRPRSASMTAVLRSRTMSTSCSAASPCRGR